MNFVELPKSAPGLTMFNRGPNTHWGRQEVIDALLELGERWAALKAYPIAIGHISRRDGSKFPPHLSHRKGVDVDIRPLRKDGKNLPVTIKQKMYDADATRVLVHMIREFAPVKLILFNDPVLVKAGLTKGYPDHSNHLHCRFDY